LSDAFPFKKKILGRKASSKSIWIVLSCYTLYLRKAKAKEKSKKCTLREKRTKKQKEKKKPRCKLKENYIYGSI
jgi:hypothetical protein